MERRNVLTILTSLILFPFRVLADTFQYVWPSPQLPVVTFGDAKQDAAMPKLYLVYFTGSWCGPCKIVKKHLQAMAKKGWQILEYASITAEQAKGCHILVVDTDMFPLLQKKMKVDQIPCLIRVVDHVPTVTVIGTKGLNPKAIDLFYRKGMKPVAQASPVNAVYVDGYNTPIHHLVAYHGYTFEQLEPYRGEHDTLNLIHGKAHGYN